VSEEEGPPAAGAGRILPSVQMLGRIVRVFLAALAVMIGLSLVWLVSGALDSFVLRVIVGLILFLVVASLGVGYFRQVANPPPPDPVPTEVHPGLRLAYVCEMCGLELAVLKVARDRAPKHCGETMLLVRRPPPEAGPDGEPEPEPDGDSERDPGASV
jgi:hypothetical protein